MRGSGPELSHSVNLSSLKFIWSISPVFLRAFLHWNPSKKQSLLGNTQCILVNLSARLSLKIADFLGYLLISSSPCWEIFTSPAVVSLRL